MVTRWCADLPGAGPADRDAALLAQAAVRPPRRSTTTRSRPRSSSPASLVVVLLVDLVRSSGTSGGIVPSLAGIGLLAALVPVLTLAVDGTDRVMFGGAYVVDNFALVLKALFLVAGYVVVLLSTNYIAEGDYCEGEYYFLLLVVAARHDGDGLGPRPHHDLRRPRAAVDPRLHARRLAQARPQGQRGGPEVLPDGRVRLGGDALRHVAALRRHRQHAARRHRRPRSAAEPSQRAVHHARHRVRGRRLRLQGVGRAVPHLGARHLRGRAHAGHRVPGGGVEGGRLRGPARAGLRRLPRPRATSSSR